MPPDVPSRQCTEEVFQYVIWSMECPMNNEEDILNYYNHFLDLCKPLLNMHLLDEKEQNMLFWYGFSPINHTMLLCNLLPSFPEQPPTAYFCLKKVFCAACNIFSQLASL